MIGTGCGGAVEPRPLSRLSERVAGTRCGTLRRLSCATTPPHTHPGFERHLVERLSSIYSHRHAMSRPALPSRGAGSATVSHIAPSLSTNVFVVPSSARPSIGPAAATAPRPSVTLTLVHLPSNRGSSFHSISRTRSRRPGSDLQIAFCREHAFELASSGGSPRKFLATLTPDPTICGRLAPASVGATAGRTSGNPRRPASARLVGVSPHLRRRST